MQFLVLILIGVAVYMLMRRRMPQRSTVTVVPPPNRPTPPRHQRMTDAELDQRAAALREAIASGTVTLDEATASLSRIGGISKASARDRLSTDS